MRSVFVYGVSLAVVCSACATAPHPVDTIEHRMVSDPRLAESFSVLERFGSAALSDRWGGVNQPRKRDKQRLLVVDATALYYDLRDAPPPRFHHSPSIPDVRGNCAIWNGEILCDVRLLVMLEIMSGARILKMAQAAFWDPSLLESDIAVDRSMSGTSISRQGVLVESAKIATNMIDESCFRDWRDCLDDIDIQESAFAALFDSDDTTLGPFLREERDRVQEAYLGLLVLHEIGHIEMNIGGADPERQADTYAIERLREIADVQTARRGAYLLLDLAIIEVMTVAVRTNVRVHDLVRWNTISINLEKRAEVQREFFAIVCMNEHGRFIHRYLEIARLVGEPIVDEVYIRDIDGSMENECINGGSLQPFEFHILMIWILGA